MHLAVRDAIDQLQSKDRRSVDIRRGAGASGRHVERVYMLSHMDSSISIGSIVIERYRSAGCGC
jgi:hypothetical protein